MPKAVWNGTVIAETKKFKKVNKGAAWSYPNPKPAAKNIKGYIAFWRGVEVTD